MIRGPEGPHNAHQINRRLVRLMMQPRCIAEIEFLPLLHAEGKQRRQLAAEAEAAVRAAYEAGWPRG